MKVNYDHSYLYMRGNVDDTMTQINAKIDEQILREFRDVIYTRLGLKKGDFKKSLEDAMLDYILKYSKSDNAKDFAKRVKSEHL